MMNKRWLWLVALVAGTALLAGCDSGNSDKETKAAENGETQEAAADTADTADVLPSGIDRSNLDPDVRPQDDFYRHVNGKWLDEVEIPADQSSWGAFVELRDRSEKAQRKLIEELAAAEGASGEAGKIADLYNSFMDQEARNALGATPMEGYLAEINAIADSEALLAMFGRLQRMQSTSPLGLAIFPDLKDSTQYTVYLAQSGLGLPNREYYFKEGERFDAVRQAYPAYIEQMLTLAGVDGAKEKAARIFAIEKRLAEHHWKPEENRIVEKIYNKYETGKLGELMPGIETAAFMEAAGIDGLDALIVQQPSYFTAMSQAVKDVPLDDWKAYLTFHFINDAAPFLSDEFVDAHFAFNGKLLNGQQELAPQWKRAVRFVNASMGEALGKIYVAEYYPPEASARMDALVENLKDAFRRSVDDLTWMTDATKEKAKEKLSKFTTKIGHPDKWRNYSKLKTAGDDLFGNAVRASKFEFQRNLDKLGEPIDKDEWFMTPQTVNAYHNPTQNEIVFPAAILQPPFFDADADMAVNYGAIGAVIGHEISHAFDDQGRKFDGEGNLTDWWTPEDAEQFTKLTDALVAQYNGYEPIEGLNVNGKLTLGENIADLSGLQIAYKAYKLSLNGEEPPVIDGLTGDQRFFMGWAQAWRYKAQEANLRRRLVSDPHSPPEYRANGIVIHMPEFHEAFGTDEGDGMYMPPEKRLKIW